LGKLECVVGERNDFVFDPFFDFERVKWSELITSEQGYFKDF
jgi:hypothetical protein